jgi:hypothetical protein
VGPLGHIRTWEGTARCRSVPSGWNNKIKYSKTKAYLKKIKYLCKFTKNKISLIVIYAENISSANLMHKGGEKKKKL